MIPGGVAPSTSRTWLALVTVWVVWGSTYFATAVLTESIPAYTGLTIRFAVGGLAVLLIVLVRDRAALRVTRVQLRTTAIMGFSFMTFSIGVLALAVHYVPTGVAALLVSVLPLWIVIIRLVTRDRPVWQTMLGVVIGLVGLAYMMLPGGTQIEAGSERDVLIWSGVIVVSSFTWALTSWWSQRVPSPQNGLVSTSYQMLFGASGLLVVALIRGERWDVAATTRSSWFALVYLAVIGSVIAWFAYVWLLRNVPLSLTSTYAYVNPIVAVLLGVAFHGEFITVDVIIGCTVVLVGVVLVVSGESLGTIVRSRASKST